MKLVQNRFTTVLRHVRHHSADEVAHLNGSVSQLLQIVGNLTDGQVAGVLALAGFTAQTGNGWVLGQTETLVDGIEYVDVGRCDLTVK